MKNTRSVIITLIVLAVLIVGGILIFHKPAKNNTASGSTTSSQNTAPAVNNAVLITKTSSSLGQYLADPSGNALYAYGGDTSGVSNCTGACLADWPAYQDKGSTTGLPAGVGTITRSDNGQVQYTYNGKPLYYFANDHNGQVTGDGQDNFSVAKPAAANSTSSQPSGTSSSGASSSSNANSSSYGNPY